MYAESFASKLKKARENTGFSQMEVSRETKISQSSLAKYETGKVEPSIEILGILSDFYQVSLDWLVGTSAHKESPKRAESKEKPSIKLYVASCDNVFGNQNGNLYIELSPEQIKKIKEATE